MKCDNCKNPYNGSGTTMERLCDDCRWERGCKTCSERNKPPFIFADWLAANGWDGGLKKINGVHYRLEGYEGDKIALYSNDFLQPLFQECQIPTTRNEAEIIFKSFNLL